MNKPEYGKTYALTGQADEKCISNGNTWKESEVKKCVICGDAFKGFGHNPEPVKSYEDGRACSTCNDLEVIPARLKRHFPEIN